MVSLIIDIFQNGHITDRCYVDWYVGHRWLFHFTADSDGDSVLIAEVVHPYAPGETIDEEDYCIHHYCPPCSKDLVKGILIKQSKERKTITPLASFNKYSHMFEIIP